VNKHSFVDGKIPFNPKYPAPRYFTEVEMMEPLAIEKDHILKGLETTA
jgi:hypothetical protein